MKALSVIDELNDEPPPESQVKNPIFLRGATISPTVVAATEVSKTTEGPLGIARLGSGAARKKKPPVLGIRPGGQNPPNLGENLSVLGI